MIIKTDSRQREIIKHMRGGDGTVEKFNYVPVPMERHVKMMMEICLNPGCSIGPHTHEGESEIFFCKAGELVLDDNGIEKPMHSGDVSICFSGEHHGITNRTKEPASVFAVIIKE